MIAWLKSRCCGQTHAAVLMLAQALVWGAVTIAVATEIRGSPAADEVTMWMSVGAFTSIMLASNLTARRHRDDGSAR